MPRRSIQTFIAVVLFTVAAVGYRVLSELARPRRDGGLSKVEVEMKEKLTMKVDYVTTLVDVKYERRKATYWFVIDLKGDAAIDPMELKKSVRNTACANAEILRTIRDKGFTYEYHYSDKADRL